MKNLERLWGYTGRNRIICTLQVLKYTFSFDADICADQLTSLTWVFVVLSVNSFCSHAMQYTITKIFLYNFYPLKPHLYIVKLGFTGVYIIFRISAQKHRLWVLASQIDYDYSLEPAEAVLASTHNLCFEQKYEKEISEILLKTFCF